MCKSDIRKRLLSYKRNLIKLQEIEVETFAERIRQYEDIKILKAKIKKLESELKDNES